jgi:hypothetical protein
MLGLLIDLAAAPLSSSTVTPDTGGNKIIIGSG